MTTTTRALRTIGLGAATFALAACAGSDTQPSEDMARAETSIRQAEQSGAAEHSALELNLAREKLDQAETAVREENYAEAERLAEQAAADAELAAARARTSEAQAAVEELQETIATLRTEAARGVRQ